MKLRPLIACGVAFLALATAQLLAQCDKPQTKLDEKVQSALSELVSQASACSGADCGTYLAKAIKTVYGVDDFSGKAARDIYKGVKSDSNWSDLGAASDQSVLDKAQQTANCNKAVLAAWTGADGSGHAALLLPGNETPSGTWKLKTPNAASFFVNSPKKSYADKPLSHAFTSATGVELYARK